MQPRLLFAGIANTRISGRKGREFGVPSSHAGNWGNAFPFLRSIPIVGRLLIPTTRTKTHPSRSTYHPPSLTHFRQPIFITISNIVPQTPRLPHFFSSTLPLRPALFFLAISFSPFFLLLLFFVSLHFRLHPCSFPKKQAPGHREKSTTTTGRDVPEEVPDVMNEFFSGKLPEQRDQVRHTHTIRFSLSSLCLFYFFFFFFNMQTARGRTS